MCIRDSTNAEVVFLGKAPTIKVSDQLAGRFFNAFGDPIDGLSLIHIWCWKVKRRCHRKRSIELKPQ